MSLKSRIDDDLKAAMKAADRDTVSILRFLKSQLKNREIELRAELDDDAVMGAISSAVKKMRESVRLYEQGDRNDLADKEKREMAILQTYLPRQMSEDDLRVKVGGIIDGLDNPDMKQMGMVMKTVMAEIGKQADGNTVSKIVKELLAAKT